jgi:hypothetical protein
MITQALVDEFNGILARQKSGLLVRLREKTPADRLPTCEVEVANSKHIKDCYINHTDEFYALLEGFFAKHGIKIMYNNTRSTFWETQA